MLQYVTYRVNKGLNDNIKLSFLPVGHTKFKVDADFGGFKVNWTRSAANCLKDVTKIAVKNKHTTVVCVGDEQGTPLVNQYDWHSFFDQHKLKTVANIRDYQHFETSVENVGVMYHSIEKDGPRQASIIIPDNSKICGNDHPTLLLPEDMSNERKNYLFTKIRKFVSNPYKDLLCPEPATKILNIISPELQLERKPQARASKYKKPR